MLTIIQYGYAYALSVNVRKTELDKIDVF